MSEVVDSQGRRWLMPMVPNPVLVPVGHSSPETELVLAIAMFGPLNKVVR